MSDEIFTTHRVRNQPPPLQDYDLYRADAALQEAVPREGAGWADDDLSSFGAALGRAETIEWGRLANANPPILRSYDRYGTPLDAVEFHPAWHEMMALGVGAGVHSAPWAEPKPGAHVARAAKVMLLVQAEAGVQCPITMTYGVVPALRRASRHRRRNAAEDLFARITTGASCRRRRQDQHADGHGPDREAGRLRPARQ